MRVAWIYTGTDNESHLAELDLPMHAVGYGWASDDLKGGRVIFRQGPAEANDFHTAPLRQLVVHLQGRAEIETGDGTKLVLGPGEVLLADDTTGHGHITRTLDGSRSSLQVAIDPQLDLTQWLVK